MTEYPEADALRLISDALVHPDLFVGPVGVNERIVDWQARAVRTALTETGCAIVAKQDAPHPLDVEYVLRPGDTFGIERDGQIHTVKTGGIACDKTGAVIGIWVQPTWFPAG